MTTYALHRSDDGQLVSVGTVVADPLPDGLTAVQLADADADGLATGSRQWDASTRACIATPGWVDPALAEGNRITIEAAITQALADLDALIAAPAVPVLPDGTYTTAQASNHLRTLRNYVQQNRAGAQQVARTLKRTIRLVRGDFDGTD